MTLAITDVFAAWRWRHRRVLRLSGTLIGGLVLAWFLGWLVIGDDFLPIRWGAYVAPWLSLLAVLSVALLLGGGQWLRAVLALLMATIILLPLLPRLDPLRRDAASRSDDLTILTFNASTLNADFGAVAVLIVREHPDVVFLQQVTDVAAVRRQISRLSNRARYAVVPDRTTDVAILSRFPLSGGTGGAGLAAATATIGRCHVRLLVLHAPHGQFSARGQQAFFAGAASALQGEAAPIIAAGDLNSTEFNSVQAPLRAVLSDAFAQVGSGFGFTFASPVRRFGVFGPTLRIDHIFYRGLEPVSAAVLHDNAGSDHFPVVARFRWPPGCGRSETRNSL